MHIKFNDQNEIVIYNNRTILVAPLNEVTTDFDDDHETVHQMSEVVKTYTAMQECTKILNDMS